MFEEVKYIIKLTIKFILILITVSICVYLLSLIFTTLFVAPGLYTPFKFFKNVIDAQDLNIANIRNNFKDKYRNDPNIQKDGMFVNFFNKVTAAQ